MSQNNPLSDFESLLREALGPPSAAPLDPIFRQQLAFEAGRAEGKRGAWRWTSGGLVGGVLLGMLGSTGPWPNNSAAVPTPEAPTPRMAKTSDRAPMDDPKPVRSPIQEDATGKDTFMARSLPLSKSSIWNPLTDPDQVNRPPLAPNGTHYISTGAPKRQPGNQTNLRSISEVMEDLK